MDRVLGQKLKKVVDARTDTPAMLEALQAIAAFYGHEGGNTAEARKSLRQDLEKQNMMLCDRFLSLFAVLRGRLDALDAHTSSLEGHCQSIHSRIDAAEESMSSFLQRARALQKQQAEVEGRAAQISAFLERFILSDAEVASLRYDPIERVTEKGERPFFAALKRVQEIRVGCSKLVGSQHQSAGFEMLEALSEHQEAAFRRLHSWILQRCAGLDRDDAADVEENDVALGLGLRTMRERPALFMHCQECLLQRRKDVVRRRFLAALTHAGGPGTGTGGGGGGGGGRPIEMQAHDPVRYLSDILAWLHQAIASEREFLRNLLGPAAANASADSSSAGDSTAAAAAAADDAATPQEKEEGEEGGGGAKRELSLAEILAGIMEGVAPLLRTRVLQLLEPATPAAAGASVTAGAAAGAGGVGSGPGSSAAGALLVLHFRLLNLLVFYEVTLTGKLGFAGSALGQVLGEACAQCQRLFEQGLRHVGEQALASPPAITMDLAAAALTAEAGRQLAEILEVHGSALLPPDSGLGSYAVDDILTAMVEPTLRACRLGAEGLDPSDAAVYMLNNAAALQASLGGHPAADRWAAKLGEEMDTWLGLLVRYQSEAVLERSGLGALLERAQAVEAAAGGAAVSLAGHPGLDPPTVAQVMRTFYQGLFALPQFERLQNPALRSRARQRTSALIAEAHEKAHALLDRPASGYADRAAFLIHTPEQVRILLDCDDQ